MGSLEAAAFYPALTCGVMHQQGAESLSQACVVMPLPLRLFMYEPDYVDSLPEW